MAQSEGQAGNEYRGVVLPEGMTRACLDELSAIINAHQREECDDLDPECAVKIFEAALRHLR